MKRAHGSLEQMIAAFESRIEELGGDSVESSREIQSARKKGAKAMQTAVKAARNASSDPRYFTRHLLGFIEDVGYDAHDVLEDLLNWLSDDTVGDFVVSEGYLDGNEAEEGEDEWYEDEDDEIEGATNTCNVAAVPEELDEVKAAYDPDHIKYSDFVNDEYRIEGLSDNTLSYVSNVLGQMSDGYWENSRMMENLWPYADVKNGALVIKVRNRYYDRNNRYCKWLDMNENHIKQYFADKIKFLVKEELGGYDKNCWRRDNDTELDWLHGTVADAYAAYDELKGRSGHEYGAKYGYGIDDTPAPDEVKEEEVTSAQDITAASASSLDKQVREFADEVGIQNMKNAGLAKCLTQFYTGTNPYPDDPTSPDEIANELELTPQEFDYWEDLFYKKDSWLNAEEVTSAEEVTAASSDVNFDDPEELERYIDAIAEGVAEERGEDVVGSVDDGVATFESGDKQAQILVGDLSLQWKYMPFDIDYVNDAFDRTALNEG